MWWLAGVMASWFGAAEPTRTPVPEPLPVDLIWNAPPACPSAEEFLAVVGANFGRRLEIDRDAAMRIDVDVRSTSDGLVMSLRIEQDGHVEPPYTFEEPECDALVRQGSIVVATRLLTDEVRTDVDMFMHEDADTHAPAYVERRTVASPREVPRTRPRAGDASSEPVDRTAAVDAAVERAPPFVALAGEHARTREGPAFVLAALVGPGFRYGPLVTDDLRLVVGGDARRNLFRFETHVDHAVARKFEGRSRVPIQVGFTRVTALACLKIPLHARVVAPLCTGASGGIVTGRGLASQLRAQPVSVRPWVGIPLELAIVCRLKRGFALRASGGVTARVIASGFHVERPGGAQETVFRYSRFSGTVLLGVEWRSP